MPRYNEETTPNDRYRMTLATPQTLASAMEQAARTAGVVILSTTAGNDFQGRPTSVFRIGLAADAAHDRTVTLELSDGFVASTPAQQEGLADYLSAAAKRLRNPNPHAAVSVAGLPLSFREFRWPFHLSTSGADTYLVHGVVGIEDGTGSPLHAKVSASMTVTFAEVVAAPEQPYAEAFVYNAVRKTLDYGQLEMLKSGNRQPVPVTTRYWSRWGKRFVFTDSSEAMRHDFLASKVFWLSHVTGGDQPVWIADTYDAQYLNTTPEELQKVAVALAAEGLLKLEGEFAAATPALAERGEHFRSEMAHGLSLTKPEFNEEMRHGHTNM